MWLLQVRQRKNHIWYRKNKRTSEKTLTAKQVPSIKATGVRFIRFVTSPTAHILGMLVCEYSSTCKMKMDRPQCNNKNSPRSCNCCFQTMWRTQKAINIIKSTKDPTNPSTNENWKNSHLHIDQRYGQNEQSINKRKWTTDIALHNLSPKTRHSFFHRQDYLNNIREWDRTSYLATVKIIYPKETRNQKRNRNQNPCC